MCERAAVTMGNTIFKVGPGQRLYADIKVKDLVAEASTKTKPKPTVEGRLGKLYTFLKVKLMAPIRAIRPIESKANNPIRAIRSLFNIYKYLPFIRPIRPILAKF